VGNDRLRQAIGGAGLEPEQLADLIEVDIRTVERWLAGRTPYPRLRTRVARALGATEHELWPDAAAAPEIDQDSADEIQGVWASTDHAGAPGWRELLEDARARVDLLDYSLIDILASDGAVDRLAEKAASGCRVRILILSPDSIWVRARSASLGQTEEDYIGRSQLALEVERTRGYLEPLTGADGIDLRQLNADPGHRILCFDHEMLISPHLHGTPITRAPMIHLRRRQHYGLFDQFATHLDALAHNASRPIEPAPELYPDPRTHPERYKPLTADTHKQLTELIHRDAETARNAGRPIEQVRAELRRPPETTDPTTRE
jgi:transcriptional regulator with XRE-family HTH domain